MTSIIIDDELRGRFALRQKLNDYCPEVQVVGEAESGIVGIELINTLRPLIVFLDIEMPHMNGFDMLSRLPVINFHLIFTTAYDEYAIKAIKCAAFDYLLKPIDIEELKNAITKISALSAPHSTSQMAILEENFKNTPNINKLAISTLNGMLFFDVSDLVHLEASSNYTVIYFKDNSKLVASRTLKHFQELLPTNLFFRCHHSHIINISYIKKYFKNDEKIEMTNGQFVELARRKKDDFLSLMGL